MIAIPAQLQAAVHGANCAKTLSVQGKEPSALRSFLEALVLSTAGRNTPGDMDGECQSFSPEPTHSSLKGIWSLLWYWVVDR